MLIQMEVYLIFLPFWNIGCFRQSFTLKTVFSNGYSENIIQGQESASFHMVDQCEQTTYLGQNSIRTQKHPNMMLNMYVSSK